MTSSGASCRRCGAAVDRPSRTCPACGYAVAGHDRARMVLGSLGTLLTLTVVFAPVGLALLWLANRHRRAAAGTVAGPDQTPLRDHLRLVARSSFDLTPETQRGTTDGTERRVVASSGTVPHDPAGGHTWR